MHLSLFFLILMILSSFFTDASGVGIGAVLMQNDGAGKQHVITFVSRSLRLKKIFSCSLGDSGRGLGTEVFS